MRLKLAAPLLAVLALPAVGFTAHHTVRSATSDGLPALLRSLIRQSEDNLVEARAAMRERPDDWRAVHRVLMLMLVVRDHCAMLQSVDAPLGREEQRIDQRELLALVAHLQDLAETERQQNVADGIVRHALEPPVQISNMSSGESTDDSGPAVAYGPGVFSE